MTVQKTSGSRKPLLALCSCKSAIWGRLTTFSLRSPRMTRPGVVWWTLTGWSLRRRAHQLPVHVVLAVPLWAPGPSREPVARPEPGAIMGTRTGLLGRRPCAEKCCRARHSLRPLLL